MTAPQLSPRELEVVALAAAGLTNSEIAEELGIQPNTARLHLAAATSKMRVSSRTAAAVYALYHGLIDLDVTYQEIVARRPGNRGYR